MRLHRHASVIAPEPCVYDRNAFVGNLDSFRGYLNDEFNQLIVELATRHQWRALQLDVARALLPIAGRKKGGWANRGLVAANDYAPSTLLFVLKFRWNYGVITQLGLQHDRILTNIVVLTDDLHWHEPASRKIQDREFSIADIVFATYAHGVELLHSVSDRERSEVYRRPPQIAWLPHATTTQFFLPLVVRTTIKNLVLLSGATSQEWYPYRHMVQRWIVRERDSRFVLLNHPGYTHFHGNLSIGRGYALYLNRHAACITDGLHLNYTVAKVFEIPAAGCLLLINAEMTPLLVRLGLFEGVHFLTYHDASTLIARVDQLLDPRSAPQINAMRQMAQTITLRRHIVAHRAAEIHANLRLIQFQSLDVA